MGGTASPTVVPPPPPTPTPTNPPRAGQWRMMGAIARYGTMKEEDRIVVNVRCECARSRKDIGSSEREE
jgi:hypothetical protein